MIIVGIGKDEVLETLATGTPVIICDFETLRIMDCKDMNISAICSFIAKDNTKFFKGVANEQKR